MAGASMEAGSFLENIQSGSDLALELVTGSDAEGRPCYVLLLLPAGKVKELRIALARKDVVLEGYGKVLAKGEGHEPPEGLIDDMMGLLTRK